MAIRIDRDRIMDEALALLRQGGLEAVSLRRIAAALGAGTSSLYWHIRDKDALLTGLTQRIFRDCLDAVGDQPGWQDWLRAFGLALWGAQRALPDVRKLIVLSRHDPAAQAAIVAEIADLLGARGLDAATATPAQRSVQALVTGWTTLSAGRPMAEGDERAAFAAALEALIAGWGVRGPTGPSTAG